MGNTYVIHEYFSLYLISCSITLCQVYSVALVVREYYYVNKDAADWFIQTSRYQRKLVRPSPVKALLNTRVLSGETHLKVGFVISGVW